MKFFIGKTDDNFNIAILLNEKDELFSVQSIIEAEEKFAELFSRKLEIGKIFFRNEEDFFFANIEGITKKPLEKLPKGWSFKDFDEISKTSPDFEAIKAGLYICSAH